MGNPRQGIVLRLESAYLNGLQCLGGRALRRFYDVRSSLRNFPSKSVDQGERKGTSPPENAQEPGSGKWCEARHARPTGPNNFGQYDKHAEAGSDLFCADGVDGPNRVRPAVP